MTPLEWLIALLVLLVVIAIAIYIVQSLGGDEVAEAAVELLD